MTAVWPFEGLQRGYYRCILADPPWRFRNYSQKGEEKNPVIHYSCMEMADIAGLPVADLAHPSGCAITMWATAPLLPVALSTLQIWGFTYKSGGAWAKRGRADGGWAFGTGYCYRSATEFWLLGARGKISPRSRSVRNLIVAPLREHSRKPDQMFDDLEALWPGPRVELFARARRDGWDAWGNEAPHVG